MEVAYKLQKSFLSEKLMAVNNQWTGILDWNSEMKYWNDRPFTLYCTFGTLIISLLAVC